MPGQGCFIHSLYYKMNIDRTIRWEEALVNAWESTAGVCQPSLTGEWALRWATCCRSSGTFLRRPRINATRINEISSIAPARAIEKPICNARACQLPCESPSDRAISRWGHACGSPAPPWKQSFASGATWT